MMMMRMLMVVMVVMVVVVVIMIILVILIMMMIDYTNNKSIPLSQCIEQCDVSGHDDCQVQWRR